jgi:hypothetical protein
VCCLEDITNQILHALDIDRLNFEPHLLRFKNYCSFIRPNEIIFDIMIQFEDVVDLKALERIICFPGFVETNPGGYIKFRSVS